MKKILIITAFALSVASAASAATLSLSTTMADPGKSVWGDKSTTATANSSPLIGKTSSGVGVGMESVAIGYGLITQHKNGTKAFGSAYDSTSIYTKDVTTGTADSTTVTTGSGMFGSGWTTL